MTCTHCQGEFRAGKEELPAAPEQEANLPASMVSPALVQSQHGQPQMGEV
jgi:hypothetical protein